MAAILRPKGQDLVNAVTDWSKKEVVDSSSAASDLGKFFFGVSSGSAGLIAVLVKVGGAPQFNMIPLAGSMVLYLVSVVFCVFMVQPRVWSMNGNTDLFDEYRKSVHRVLFFTWSWFLFWLIATILGAAALF